jgi:hypothetical protein
MVLYPIMEMNAPGRSTRLIGNVVLFQAAWFASVLGAARGLYWAGPAVTLLAVAVRLAQAEDRRKEALLLLCCGILGFAADTALVALGLFLPVRGSFPTPWSPPWMVAMWVNFGATLNVSMAFLKGRPAVSAVFGAIGGPLAYFAGARLGAASIPEPAWAGLAAVAVAWGIAMPALSTLAGRDLQASSLLRKR